MIPIRSNHADCASGQTILERTRTSELHGLKKSSKPFSPDTGLEVVWHNALLGNAKAHTSLECS